MKYLIYERVSSEKQEVETQRHECLNYIKRKENGCSFEYNIYSDPETTTRKKMENRKGLMEFIKSLREGHKVVVYKLDRLSRDVIEMVTIYRMIKDKGCTIYSLNDPDCDNDFIIGLMGVLAQKERKDISDRTKASLRYKISKNERIGMVPYGYQICPTTLVPTKDKQGKVEMKLGYLIEEPKEKEILTEMCHLFDEGLSFRQIADVLKEQGHVNRKGKPFQHMSLYRILRRTGRKRLIYQALDEQEFLKFHQQG